MGVDDFTLYAVRRKMRCLQFALFMANRGSRTIQCHCTLVMSRYCSGGTLLAQFQSHSYICFNNNSYFFHYYSAPFGTANRSLYVFILLFMQNIVIVECDEYGGFR